MKRIAELDKALENKTFENINRIVLNEYIFSLKKDLEYLDLNGTIFPPEVEGIVEALKEYGIKTFTYSRNSSNTLENIAKFVKLGATLKGMTKAGDFDAFLLEL